MPIVCKKPKCVLSKDKTKCIKPNPYIQFISHCGKSGKTSDECKDEYYKNSNEIKKKACDYFESNKKIGNIKSCPKSRRPVNNKCPDDYPVMKTNKHNVKCCYKATTKATTKKTPIKKAKKIIKKVSPISSDDIPINQLRRAKKVVTPFESAESSKRGKKSTTPFESAESSKRGKKSTTPFESAESSKRGKKSTTPFESAESAKSSEKKDEVNRFKMGNKLYKLAKVQKYKGRIIPVKVIKHKFPKHKIDEVLRELEKPRKIASITQSSPMKEKRKATSRKIISAPSKIKYLKDQEQGWFDWIRGKRNKPPSKVIDNELNKKIEKIYQQESDKRHRQMYPDKYAKNLTRKEIELLKQADAKYQSKGIKPISDSFSFGNKAKNRYQGHMSAPESISLNKGQLKVSVPSLDPKARKYLDDQLMKNIEEIKAKVPPKKQKGWFQKLFGNESSSISEEKKNKKKWYEY